MDYTSVSFDFIVKSDELLNGEQSLS